MGFFGKDKPEEKPVPETPKPETPKQEKPRKRVRRSKEVVARERLAKGQAMVDDAKRVIAEIEKARMTKERKRRLMPLAGMLLNVVDEYAMPDGVTEADFLASLRILLAGLRRKDGEESETWKARVAPAIDAVFGKKDRSPAQEAAIRILTGHTKAAETVVALRPKKKGKGASAPETPEGVPSSEDKKKQTGNSAGAAQPPSEKGQAGKPTDAAQPQGNA